MVFFLGILHPAKGSPVDDAEAPSKRRFFGGKPAEDLPTDPERDSAILRAGKPLDLEADLERRYAMSNWPYPL
ncbi:hypothetical protein EMQ25_06460 [Arsenicitalea aurantiaca]|uniref:Uncharacterized protein n=1 Tax=Arsenicitalea aurantiaca TaxID=1783274 RepID=A0A433XFA2_9HYPH|nr:hypothetical protein [Arsenicitalea aurantiaca]RUT32781.1 hypothetical protein EMQ25_06460 [Arsenicitalea aurantiaca]